MWARRARVLSFILGSLLVGWSIWEVLSKGKRCIRCEMSLMHPDYEELSQTVTSDRAHKYRLFRYYDVAVEKSKFWDPKCIPVLFVPGNCGSYRQVRSFASQLFHDSAALSQCYNVYTVDFREEFVASSAHLLLGQAAYLQRVALHLLERHPQSASLILLGHSYGGFVLRLAQLQDVWGERGILLITLASPHQSAPLTCSRELKLLYSRLESTSEDELNIISIGSGETDILVHAELSRMPQKPRAFYQRVDSLGGNWAHPTHDAIVWERGLLRLLNRAVFLFETHRTTFHEDLRELMSPRKLEDSRFTLGCSAVKNLTTGTYGKSDLCTPGVAQVCLGYESARGLDFSLDKDFPATISLNQAGQQIITFEYPSQPIIRLVNGIGGQTDITQKKVRYMADGRVKASILLRCAGETTQLYEMSKSEWLSLIQNGEEEFSKRLASSSMQIHETGTITRVSIDLGWMGFWRLLLPGGHRLAGDGGKGLIVNLENANSMAREMIIRINSLDADVLWTTSKDGSKQFPVQDSQRSYQVALEPDLVEIGILFTETTSQCVRVRVDLFATLVKSLHTRYDGILTCLFMATLIGEPFMVGCAFLLIRAVLVSLANYSSSRLLVDSLFALWIAICAHWLLRNVTDNPNETSMRTRLKIGLVATIFIAPCITSAKVAACVTILTAMDLYLYRRLSVKMGVVLLAAIPMILESILEVRNLLIIGTDVGLGAVVKELEPVWTGSLEVLSIALYLFVPTTKRARSGRSLWEATASHIHLTALSLELQKSYMMVGFLLATQLI